MADEKVDLKGVIPLVLDDAALSIVTVRPNSIVQTSSTKDHYIISIRHNEKRVFWGVHETFKQQGDKVRSGQAYFTVLPSFSMIFDNSGDTKKRFVVNPRGGHGEYDLSKPFSEYAQVPLFEGGRRIGSATIFEKDHTKVVYRIDRKRFAGLGEDFIIESSLAAERKRNPKDSF